MAQEKFYFKSTMDSLKIPDFDPVSVAMESMRKSAMDAVYGYGASRVAFDEDHPAPEEEKEEWVWIEGYKGTDRFMRCRGYQYELGKRFDMPEDAEIRECESGFHLCSKLDSVLSYYPIADDNRFFRVRALVRKPRYANKYEPQYIKEKYAAKSIEFISELTTDEIFDLTGRCRGWPDEDKVKARSIGVDKMTAIRKARPLVELGYDEELARFIVERGGTEAAMVLGRQTNISMDTKIQCIFTAIY